jgi:putative membrane protein
MTRPPRRPGTFDVESDPRREPANTEPATPRKPRIAAPETAVMTPLETDVFERELVEGASLPAAVPPRRRSRLATIFWSALGALVALAIGLWTDALVRELFDRAEWLGWVGLGLAIIAAASLLVITTREVWALARLSSVERLRARASEAIARDDSKLARGVVDDLVALLAAQPATAAGRRSLADLRGEIIDGANLIGLAETEVLVPLDVAAKALVLDAAKRVSIVTAVSPRALVDIAYVVFESARLIRRISELYGARPGTLGFIRLARDVLAHLAVTGSIAAGDSVIQQLIGHGLAARLSAKLGEGIVNGMMTARIGLAAMEMSRPLPFAPGRRPGLGSFVSALTKVYANKFEQKQ